MRVIAGDDRPSVSMAALEKSDFDQCASCRNCTLESMRTQASFDLCAPFPISRFTDSTARVSKRLTDETAACLRARYCINPAVNQDPNHFPSDSDNTRSPNG